MKIKTLGKWLLTTIIVILVLLPLLLFTQMGNRLLISGLNLLPFLAIDFEEGHILGDARFEFIELDFEVIVIRIDKLEYALQGRCLLQSQLCMSKLSANSIKIDMPEVAESEPEEEPEQPPALIVLPIDIRINNIAVDKFTFEQSAIAVTADNLNTNFNAKGSHFLVAGTNLKSLIVALKDGNEGANAKANNQTQVQAQTQTNNTADTWPLKELPDVFLPVDLQIKDLLLEDFDLRLSADPEQIPPIATNQLQLSARWSGYLLAIEQFNVNSPEYGSVKLDGSMDWQYPWGTQVNLLTELKDFPWYPDLNGSRQTINVSGDFSQLAVQLLSEGKFRLSADVQTNIVDSKMPFIANLQTSDLDLQSLIAQPLLIKQLQSQVSGDLYQQQFNAETQLQGFGYQQGKVTLKGTHKDKVVKVNNLSFRDAASDSSLNGQVNLDYSQALAMKVDANILGLTLPEFTAGQVPVQGRIKGQLHLVGEIDTSQLPQSLEQRGKWKFSSYNTRLEGVLNEQPALLHADFSVNQELAVKDAVIKARFQDSQLDLSGYSGDNWHVSGRWQGAEFQRWHPQLQGQMTGDIRISGALLDPKIALEADLQSLQYTNISVPQADIDINYWPAQNHRHELTISSPKANIQANQLSEIRAALKGDIEQQNLAVDASGDLPVHLVVDNRLDLDKLVSKLDIKEASLGFNDYIWKLVQEFSTTIVIDKGLVNIMPHCWMQAENEICVNKQSQIGNDGNAHLSWKLNLGDYDQLLLGQTVELDSRISGSANVLWEAFELTQMDLQNDIGEGGLTLIGEEKKSTLLTWSDGKISATGDKAQANVDLYLNRSAGDQLIAGDAQITLSQESLPIQGNLDIERFQMQVIEELVPGMSKARGDFSAAIDFSGAVTDPILSGKMSLHDGELATYQSPNSIDNINIDMQFQGQSADVDGGFMIKEHPGEITASFDWQDGLDAKARFFAEKLPILFPPNLNAMVGADIHLDLSDQIAKVGGEIKVLDGLFQLEDLPEGSIKVSDDAIIVDASGKEVEKEKTLAITSDVDLSINPKFKLKGQGFTGNLGGKLKIRQEKFQPVQLFGVLKIANGKYQAYGQNLDVQSGEISFVGSPSNPTINVKAVREIKDENVTAGLSIVGPTDALSLTFFSNPSMPQPEILSYITRGRGLDSNSGGGGAAVGLALASAITKTTPIQNVVQKLPLLTDVSLDAEVEGDTTQATISGYLGERIFLKYGVGVYEPINELTVRLYLMSRLWLETVSGLESSADLYYSFEID